MENPPLRLKLRLTIMAAGLAGLATMHLVARAWRTAPVVVEFVEESEPVRVPPPEPSVAAPPPTPPPAGERLLRFRDGSLARLASGETRLDPISVHERRVVTELVAGAAHLQIVRRPTRVFRVVAGAISVEATTAVLDLARREARLFVHVREGRVRVMWPNGRRSLGQGDQGLFPPDDVAARAGGR
ncbi:MAG TPA: FecR domain-containing protein [Polyangia bacterium]|jgi:hypothetical protein|nr:FecR domain-containing protein [Polyangia bacterium]